MSSPSWISEFLVSVLRLLFPVTQKLAHQPRKLGPKQGRPRRLSGPEQWLQRSGMARTATVSETLPLTHSIHPRLLISVRTSKSNMFAGSKKLFALKISRIGKNYIFELTWSRSKSVLNILIKYFSY